MGRASRNKRHAGEEATSQVALAPPPSWAAPLLIAAAAAGVVVAGVSSWIYFQVTSSGGAYTSFCNVNDAVNCDSVVTSPYGKVLGVPVSLWAIAYYLLVGWVGMRARGPSSSAADRARSEALGLALLGAAFSAYMAFVSAVVLETVCVLCAGLYVVALAALFAAWRLASPVTAALLRLRDRWNLARRRPALATAVAAVVVAVLLVPAWLGAPILMTRDEVFRSNPQFFDWYTSQPVVDAPVEGGHARGPEKAPIQLVEFSDFECPHCRRAHVTLRDLLSRYPGQVRFVFHHFPLSNECNDTMENAGHRDACEAAVAAECAGEQGGFDAFVNLLFANQENLGAPTLRRLAKDSRLDVGQFEKCLTGSAAPERVKTDVEVAKRAGVRSTPTFFLNGRRLEGNLTYESWLMAFAIELDKG